MNGLFTFLSLFIFCFSQVTHADILVVANKDNQIKILTKKQVIDIYMGRKSRFPNGEIALAIDQKSGSLTRKIFYHDLVDKTVSEINAYWAKLLFSGRASPPKMTENSASVVDIIKNNKSAIGYIQSEELTDEVKVLCHVD